MHKYFDRSRVHPKVSPVHYWRWLMKIKSVSVSKPVLVRRTRKGRAIR